MIWPRQCAACGRPLELYELDWCGPCAAEVLEASRFDYCPSCGQTAGRYVIRDGRCPACAERKLGCDGVVRAARYEGAVRQAIFRYKYGRDQTLDRLLGGMVHAAIQGVGLAGKIDCFVPIPLHWKRMIWRRFNQSALIARLLARRERAACLSVLRRVQDRPPQVRVPRSQRAANVRGVFAPKRGARHLAGCSVCIVDDITTTGSTIREAARVLRRFHPELIYTAVIAVAEHDDTSDLELQTL